MKLIKLSSFALAVIALVLASAIPTQAQEYGFYLIDFQCDPLSCEESGPFAPVSSAEVNWYAICQLPDGSQGDLSSGAIAAVGVDGPCPAPYTPVASASLSSLTLTDEYGSFYQVDYISNVVEIFDSAGAIDLYGEATFGCDGTFGTTGVGAIPC